MYSIDFVDKAFSIQLFLFEMCGFSSEVIVAAGVPNFILKLLWKEEGELQPKKSSDVNEPAAVKPVCLLGHNLLSEWR